jgi:hypothetical protein
MPTEFTGREPEISSDAESSMFGATPVWDRARKRRGFGGRKSAAPRTEVPKTEAAPPPAAAEPRSFAPDDYSTMGPAEQEMILDRPLAADQPLQTGPTVTNSTLAAEEPLAAPIGPTERTRTVVAKKSGPSSAMIAGGVAVLALIGVGGWYLARPHDGVPELAPGQPTTSEVAAAPVMPAIEQPAEVDRATNTLPSRAGPARAAPTQVAQAAPRARVRPAAARAPSAGEAGTNASAVLPEGPKPYSALNPSAPTQVTPAPAAPAPTEAAPSIPQTPPVEPPASQTTPPETTPPSA